jgi:hypothetical protein
VTAPNYVDLETLKGALNIRDDVVDPLLGTALAAASRAIDRSLGRQPGGFSLDATATARTYRVVGHQVVCDDGMQFLVDEFGTLDGLVVEIGGPDTWQPVTDAEHLPENALARGRPITRLQRLWWAPGPFSRVRVTARWGWPAIPDEIEQAALIQATRLYRRKDSPEGVLGSAEWGAIRLSRVDPDVQALIGDLALPGFA